jgi:two-component system response regulator AtoC
MGSPSTARNASTILVVDDEPSMLRYMRMLLEVDSYEVETVSSGFAAMERVRRSPAPDVVLLDLLMPQMDGIQALEQLRQIRPGLKVIMLTCEHDPRKVVQAIRLGAQDYLTKPFHKAELDAALRSCLATQPSLAETIPWVGEVGELGDDSIFVAASPAMQKIRAQAMQVANINVPVLLLGESGTGKEVVARLIWKLSARAHRTFMKVNCAALPSELLESELFGYEAGAFTGANRAKPGRFELCDKGTILLDEIAEMPPGLQAKLLQVLQDQQFSRLGSRTTVSVDVRILAATNVHIEQALAAKKLREDLYYRLNAFTLHLPPLRERREEIPLLLKQFMAIWAERYARPPLPVSQSFIEACCRCSWPGNVRELENLVKRYLILGDEALVLSDLETNGRGQVRTPGTPTNPTGAPAGDLKSLVRGLKGDAEAKAITRTLEQTNWSRKEAARLLNISYKALLYKIRQYGIDQS